MSSVNNIKKSAKTRHGGPNFQYNRVGRISDITYQFPFNGPDAWWRYCGATKIDTFYPERTAGPPTGVFDHKGHAIVRRHTTSTGNRVCVHPAAKDGKARTARSHERPSSPVPVAPSVSAVRRLRRTAHATAAAWAAAAVASSREQQRRVSAAAAAPASAAKET